MRCHCQVTSVYRLHPTHLFSTHSRVVVPQPLLLLYFTLSVVVQSSTAPEIVIDGNHGNINNNNNKASPVIDGSLIGE